MYFITCRIAVYDVFGFCLLIRFDHDNAEVIKMSDNIVYQNNTTPIASEYDTMHFYEELTNTDNQEKSNLILVIHSLTHSMI